MREDIAPVPLDAERRERLFKWLDGFWLASLADLDRDTNIGEELEALFNCPLADIARWLSRLASERKAPVEFDRRDTLGLLDAATVYAMRGRPPREEPPPQSPLWVFHEMPPHRTRQKELRRAVVDQIEGVWSESRRRAGVGAHYSPELEEFTGPLLVMMEGLFWLVGERPGRSLLCDDLRVMRGGGERKSGKHRKPRAPRNQHNRSRKHAI